LAEVNTSLAGRAKKRRCRAIAQNNAKRTGASMPVGFREVSPQFVVPFLYPGPVWLSAVFVVRFVELSQKVIPLRNQIQAFLSKKKLKFRLLQSSTKG